MKKVEWEIRAKTQTEDEGWIMHFGEMRSLSTGMAQLNAARRIFPGCKFRLVRIETTETVVKEGK